MLEARNLSKKYGERHALTDLNLSVKPGEVYCLLGANGAGKTTTINLFLNFIAPTGGKAIINEVEVFKNPLATKAYVGFIPENLILYPNLSGMENLKYFSLLAGKHYDKNQLRQLLEKAGLQHEAHGKKLAGYSKGMRQKVGIAIALAKKSKALLLDEPTSSLDPKSSNEFSCLIKELSQQGMAILMVTHDLFRAQDTGSHIGIMKDGSLLENLKSEEITLGELEKIYLKHMN